MDIVSIVENQLHFSVDLTNHHTLKFIILGHSQKVVRTLSKMQLPFVQTAIDVHISNKDILFPFTEDV